jgi:hypothetical protein
MIGGLFGGLVFPFRNFIPWFDNPPLIGVTLVLVADFVVYSMLVRFALAGRSEIQTKPVSSLLVILAHPWLSGLRLLERCNMNPLSSSPLADIIAEFDKTGRLAHEVVKGRMGTQVIEAMGALKSFLMNAEPLAVSVFLSYPLNSPKLLF